jgi:hypothetical protein
VGRKEIAQNELWMRKKLMIKDAHPMCIHTMSTKANLEFACYICLLVCLLFLFFGMGQVVGVVAVWNKNWNGSFFYCKFKKI